MEAIINNLKDFIWDIIGFLIPGLILSILLNLIVLPDVGISNNFLFKWDIFQPYLLLIIAYTLGYVIYGFSIIKLRINNKIIKLLVGDKTKQSYRPKKMYKIIHFIVPNISFLLTNSWETSLRNSFSYKMTLKQKIFDENQELEKDIHDIRNIQMSSNPKMDYKIYTFMFRSELFNHLSTILILITHIVLFQFVLKYFDIFFIKIDLKYIVIYTVLFLLIYPLELGRSRFLSIAMKIPFTTSINNYNHEK